MTPSSRPGAHRLGGDVPHARRGGPGAGAGGGLPELFVDFRRLAGAVDMTWTLGEPEPSACRPPRARGPAAAHAIAGPDAESIGQSDADRHAGAHAPGTPDPPDTPSTGRASICRRAGVRRRTELFGDVELDRDLTLVAAQDGWKVRW